LQEDIEMNKIYGDGGLYGASHIAPNRVT